MRRLFLLAATLVTALASSATGQTPASSLRALVYCPVAIDASGCDQIATALTGTFATVDKGYDGTAGTINLATANLDQYALFIVPSLADGGSLMPYSLLRDPGVAPRLARILRGRAAIWSGTPDQGAANRDAKNTLIRNLAGWAVQSYAATGRAGVVVLQDQSVDAAQRYAWLAGISSADVLADPNSDGYDAVESLTGAGTEILANGAQPSAPLAYANMASFGLHLPVDATGTLAGAIGATSNRQVVLVTYQGGEGPAEFFVMAHQDDWQLFLGNRAAASVQAANKVVFVYTTAGDAGAAADYWQAREVAANASVDAIAPPGAWTCAPQTIGAHAIRRCAKANTVSYYLRLPDGNGEGQGYSGRGSLAQLRGQGRSLAALDASSTYASWDDLVSTVQAIVALEAAGQSEATIAVHTQDWEVMVNSGDHSDHIATGDVVRAAGWGHAWSLFWYMGYPVVGQPVNLTGAPYDLKWSTIVAYDNSIKGNYGTILGSRAVEWASRTIYRSELSSGSPLVRPAAPGDFRVTPVDRTRIDLTWVDTFTGEAGFRVERAADEGGSAGGFQVNATLPPNTTSWPSTELRENTRYWYRVRAFTASGSSLYSPEVSGTTPGACTAPAIGSQPVGATTTPGQTITLSVTASGTASLSFQWRRNGSPISGAISLATTSSYEISSASASDAGNYDVVVTNGCGTATSAVAAVVVAAASATVTLSDLAQTYDGSAKFASATTEPADLAVTLAYTLNGASVEAPVDAGSYAVTATIADENYEGSATGTLTIAKATPTIAWMNPPSIAFGTPLSGSQLNASADNVNGGALAGTFTYSPAAGTVLPAGTSPLMTTFVPADGTNYTSATQAVFVQVLQAGAAFGGLGSQTITYGTSSITLAGTLTAGAYVPGGNVVVTLRGSSQAAPLQADGSFSSTFNTASIDASATPYAISYTYAGDGNVSAATDNSTSLTVNRATASIILANLSHSYTGTAKAAQVTTTPAGLSGVSVAYIQGGAAVTPINAGSYNVVASLTNPNYQLAGGESAVTGVLVIAGAPLSVTAANASRAYGDANPSFAGTITGVLPGDLISATYGSVANAASATGSYAVVPALVDPQGRLANYNVVVSNGTLTITKAPLTVTPASLGKTYGQEFTAFTGAITGRKNNDAITASYASAGAAAGSAVGSYPITATVNGTAATLENYTITSGTGTLTITRASLTAAAGNATRTYGDANPAFTGTLTGVLPADGITATYASAASVTSPVGSHAIVPALTDPQGKLANYDVTLTNGTLSITTASLTVTPAAAARLYGDNNPTFTGAIQGLKNGDAISATYSTLATPTSAVGSYEIIATMVDATPSRLANYQVTRNTGTLTIGVAALSITANPKSRAYGGTNPVFDGVITGIRNGDAISASYATVATAASAVGSYQITASATGAPGTLGNYAITTNAGTLTITPAPLTVTAAPATKLYGAALPVFSAAYEGFVLGQGPSVLGGTLGFATTASAASNVGTYSVTPSGLTATNYAITFAPGALTVNRAPLTVTADNKNKQYDGQAFTGFTASYTGFVLGQGPTVLGGTLSFSGPAVGATDVGTYAVTPAGVTSDNYQVGFVAGSLSIGRPTLTVTAASASREYGVANPAFTGTVNGLIAGDGITVSYASSAATTSAIGSYAIVPTLADPNGNLANYTVIVNNGALTVTTAPLTITPDNRAKTYGQAVASFSGSVVGIRNGDAITASYASAGGAAGSAVGSYDITATPNGAAGTLANYSITRNTGTLTVNRAALTVTADNKNKQYDGQAFTAFTASYTGFVLGQGPAVLGGTLAFSGSGVGATDAGTYAIVPAGLTSGNYQIGFVAGSLSIGRPTLTVAAASTSREYGAANPSFTGIVNGLIAGDGITVSYSSAAVATSPVGPYAIVPTLADPNGKLANYTVTVTNGTLSVTTAALTVTPENRSKTYGEEMSSFSGSIVGIRNSDAITASYASAGGAAASNFGSYDITATLNGNPGTLANYAVTRNTGTLTVNRAALTVTADNKTKQYDGQAFTTFTASYTGFVLGQGPAVLGGALAFSGPAVGATGAGSYAITPGGVTSNNYQIGFVPGSLQIGRPTLTVTAASASREYGAANPAFTGIVNGLIAGDGITAAYSSAAGATSPVGTYPVVPTLSDPNGKLTNYAVTVNNGTLSVTTAPLTVTPANAQRSYGDANPAFTGALQGIRNNDDITPTYSTAATATSAVGQYEITATLDGAPATLGNYVVSRNVGTLTIAAAPLSIVANNATREYGAGNPPFGGVITGTRNNEVISVTYATTATAGSGVGTYAITPTAAGGTGASLSNYAVTVTNGALVVTTAPLTVTPIDRAKTYGQSVTDFTGSIVGIRNDDDITASYASPGAAVASAVGSYVISATLQGAAVTSGNYAVTRNTGALTVTRAPLTVKANDATRQFGEANPPFTATYNGFVAGETYAALGGSLTFATAATPSSPAGEYAVTPGGVTSSNYAITFVAGKLLIITKATPTISWSPVDVTNPTALGATQLNAVAYGINGTTPVAGTYVYSSNGTTVTTATVLPPGVNVPLTVTFTPTGADASNYGPATMTVTTFNVLAKIDITPGSTSNAISLAGTQKEIVVGVVSSANFDARTLVVSGVTPTLGNGIGAEAPVALNTNGTPKTGLTDLNADGRLDVLFYFTKATLISNGDVTSATTKLFLQGQFSDGRMIKGVDKVSVIP